MYAMGTQDLFVLLLSLLIYLSYRYRRGHRIPLPPGPTRWPIFGNALMIPSTYVHVFYEQLGKKLGSKIVYLEAFGQSLVVINDLAMAQELLEKRSATYSSRLSTPMLSDIAGVTELFAFMPYGSEWRMHRRILQRYLSEKNLPYLLAKVLDFIRKGLLANLLTDPNDLSDHLRNSVGGLSLYVTYGQRVKRQHDPLVCSAEEGFGNLARAVAPGNHLVNVLPLLKYLLSWMPGSSFKQEAEELRRHLNELRDGPYGAAMQMIEEGTAPLSLVSYALDGNGTGLDDEVYNRYVKQTAFQIFAAVSETTVASIMTFVLAMVTHPDVQLRAQKEVDLVVGPNRLPEFSDIPDLIFISAIVKEVLRWNPVFPLGLPHATSEEDDWNGYRIPKGCLVLANVYAMFHDEAAFPEPHLFQPERFISEDGTLRQDLLNPEFDGSFGFGRRVCPGDHLARSMLYITIASLLYLFDINPTLDSDGKYIDIKPEFSSASIISDPLPFPCSVTPRKGKDVKSLLRDFLGSELM